VTVALLCFLSLYLARSPVVFRGLQCFYAGADYCEYACAGTGWIWVTHLWELGENGNSACGNGLGAGIQLVGTGSEHVGEDVDWMLFRCKALLHTRNV